MKFKFEIDKPGRSCDGCFFLVMPSILNNDYICDLSKTRALTTVKLKEKCKLKEVI
jgi:hypothetical protein